MLFVGLPVFLSQVTGSSIIPHNDAWSHSKIAEMFALTGEVHLVGWNRSALVGQMVVLGSLGSSIGVQQIFVSFLSLIALIATYLYLLPRVGSVRALLGMSIVGASPSFGLLATSYMSDMPAFAAMMICLVLSDRAIATGRVSYFAAALVFGLWGVTIREQAVVAPGVAMLVTVLAWNGRKRIGAIALSVVALILLVIFEIWRRSLPFGDPPSATINFVNFIPVAIRMPVTIGLFLAPAIVLVARPLRWSSRTRWISFTILILLLAAKIGVRSSFLLGNYLSPSGAYSDAFVGTREVIPKVWWWGIVLLAVVSVALVVGIVLDSGIQADRTTLLVMLLLIGGTLGQAALGQGVFGRYLLPLIPMACVPILKVRGRPQWILALVVLASLAVTSLAITANALSFDAARWNAASQLQLEGVPAMDISAGLEWVGYHSKESANQLGGRPKMLHWTDSMFSDSRECYVISASQLPIGDLVSSYDYSTYALFGNAQLWIYETHICQ